VVIWDTGANRAVTTTTTADDSKTAGVWVGRTSNGGYGRVLVRGIGVVNGGAAITRGNLLRTHTAAKQAVQDVTGIINVSLGRALETTSGSGLILVYVNVHRARNSEFLHYQDQKTSGTNPASIVQAAWRTRELNTEVVDTANLGSLAANQVTLQPGTYIAWMLANGAVASSSDRLRLRDTTGGVTLFQGSNGRQGTAIAGFGVFTITVVSALEVQHFCTTTGNGGTPVTTGEVEVYADFYLWRIGEAA
jgi:hypothetical protein